MHYRYSVKRIDKVNIIGNRQGSSVVSVLCVLRRLSALFGARIKTSYNSGLETERYYL